MGGDGGGASPPNILGSWQNRAKVGKVGETRITAEKLGKMPSTQKLEKEF